MQAYVLKNKVEGHGGNNPQRLFLKVGVSTSLPLCICTCLSAARCSSLKLLMGPATPGASSPNPHKSLLRCHLLKEVFPDFPT